METRFLLNF